MISCNTGSVVAIALFPLPHLGYANASRRRNRKANCAASSSTHDSLRAEEATGEEG
jgi:hypothetical protein